MGSWLNVGVEGEAIWPKEETKINFDGYELILKPATKKFQQSIHVDLQSVSDVEALTLINRFLSILSWCDDLRMENLYGGYGSVVPVPVPIKTRTIGSSIDFPFERDLEENPKAILALALYREGLTVNSVPFSFLSYFKILNIFWNDKYIKDEHKNKKNEIIEGIRETLGFIDDSEAKERIDDLSKQSEDVPKYLYESGRCAVAHAFSNPIVDPDDVSHLRRLSEDIWIIRAIAEHLIENKLNVSKSIHG